MKRNLRELEIDPSDPAGLPGCVTSTTNHQTKSSPGHVTRQLAGSDDNCKVKKGISSYSQKYCFQVDGNSEQKKSKVKITEEEEEEEREYEKERERKYAKKGTLIQQNDNSWTVKT